MFKKILVCVDGSECGEHAAQVAIDIAWKFGAEVVLINVCDLAAATAPFLVAPEAIPNIGGIGEYMCDAQKTLLAEARQLFEKQGISLKVRGDMGQPVDLIVRAAEEERADLIVLGSRGMGGFTRLMLGSVSDGVLHHAHCPVMIVK